MWGYEICESKMHDNISQEGGNINVRCLYYTLNDALSL